MYKVIVTAILILSFLTNCNKQIIAKGTPNCIKKKISNFSNESTCEDATVSEYRFQEKNVFVFEPGTCGADMTSEVFSEDCTSLGMLGGFVGNTQINGEDFASAEFVKVCWEK